MARSLTICLSAWHLLCLFSALIGLPSTECEWQWGRVGVHEAQHMFRLLGGHSIEDSDQKLDLGKRVVSNLPDAHWLKRNEYMSIGPNLDRGGGEHFADMIMHPQVTSG